MPALDCLNWMKMDPIIANPIASCLAENENNIYIMCIHCLGIRNRTFIPDHPNSIKRTMGSVIYYYMFQGTKNFKFGAVGECMLAV